MWKFKFTKTNGLDGALVNSETQIFLCVWRMCSDIWCSDICAIFVIVEIKEVLGLCNIVSRMM